MAAACLAYGSSLWSASSHLVTFSGELALLRFLEPAFAVAIYTFALDSCRSWTVNCPHLSPCSDSRPLLWRVGCWFCHVHGRRRSWWITPLALSLSTYWANWLKDVIAFDCFFFHFRVTTLTTAPVAPFWTPPPFGFLVPRFWIGDCVRVCNWGMRLRLFFWSWIISHLASSSTALFTIY